MRVQHLIAAVAACTCLTLASPGIADEAETIMDLEAQWSDHFGARNLDAIMALMAEDTVVIMPGAPPLVGREAVRAATADMLASDAEVSWKSDFAFVAPSGDMAYDYGTATTRMADGTETTGQYLVVWVKENGEWRVAADMFN